MNISHLVLTVFQELTTSDAIGDPPARWFILTTGAMAHCLMGVAFAWWYVPRRLCEAMLVAFIVKELCGDIPKSGYDLRVIADSVIDLSAAVLGWRIVNARWQSLGLNKSALMEAAQHG